MQFLCRFCLLVVVCSVLELYKRVLQVFFELLLMDFASCLKLLTVRSDLKSGFWLLGCFSPAFSILGLILMFYLGLKYLQIASLGKGFFQFFYEIRGKSGVSNNWFCSKLGFNQVFDSKFVPFLINSKDSNNGFCSKLGFNQVSDSKFVPLMENPKLRKEKDSNDDEGTSSCIEDEEFDVISLRRMVKIERYKGEMANVELEKERMASASAANEAMSMISRLQFEKSSIEIEANQFRRMAEQQKAYDDEVIRSLQWTVMTYESERDELVKNLKFCEQKLNLLMNGNDSDLDSDLEEDSSMFDMAIGWDSEATGETTEEAK